MEILHCTKVQKVGGTETENLHRNMLFPFVGVRELDEDVAEEEIRELPAKSFAEYLC